MTLCLPVPSGQADKHKPQRKAYTNMAAEDTDRRTGEEK